MKGNPVNGIDPTGLYVKPIVMEVWDYIGIKEAGQWLAAVGGYWVARQEGRTYEMVAMEQHLHESLWALSDPTAFLMNRLNKFGKGWGAIMEFVEKKGGGELKNNVVDLSLKYMPSWTKAQRACADGKCQALTKGFTQITEKIKRVSESAASRFKKAWNSIPEGSDIDHIIDIQLGWKDSLDNMSPLNSSVNRSLGAQIYQKIKNLPIWTVIGKVTISD